MSLMNAVWVARPESAKGVVEQLSHVIAPFAEPQGVPAGVPEAPPCP